MRPITDLQRRVEPFQVISDYVPAGDQPAAIEEIVKRINAGAQDVVLLGATGTGKSATTAWMNDFFKVFFSFWIFKDDLTKCHSIDVTVF